jgi:hypothetical protein
MIYLIIIAAILLLIIIGLYNSLIRKKNEVENAFASIDVILKKRYDLIPKLVETVKGYMQHEKSLSPVQYPVRMVLFLRIKLLKGCQVLWLQLKITPT